MTEKTVPVKREHDVPMTREEERYLKPPVDIYEYDDGLKVIVDIPGVSQDNIDVDVDNGLLTIKGKVQHDDPSEPVHREFKLISFFRQFELNDQVDQEKISAALKHGVLTLDLPKVEKAKPRKISVAVD